MKSSFYSLIFASSLFLFSGHAMAQTKWGADCGLAAMEDFQGIPGTSLDLSAMSKKDLLDLPLVLKQQVIIMAKLSLKESATKMEIKSVVQAVNYLKSFDGPYVDDYMVNGRRITQILTFPGDNAWGVLFETGTLNILGFNQDGDVACAE